MTPSDYRVLSAQSLPHRLADLGDPPTELHVWGDIPRGPAVGIVGTRNATDRGMAFAESLAHDLARAGVAVFSGGAEGIDTAAHSGALRAGGTTVVVAPSGFDCPYPEFNAALFERVVREGGAYLSLVSDGTKATQPAFFSRNAVLAALSHVVVIVEAGFRSGALNTARWARELGRPLFAVPHFPGTEKGRGCLAELKRGAAVCEGPRDILRQLDRLLLSPLPLDRAPGQPNLPFDDTLPGPMADAERVKAAIRAGASNLDEISELTGLSVAVIQRQILTLTLDGVLAPDASGRLALSCATRPSVSSKA